MLEAIVLGIVEGLTEFLPISSTGHLLIFQHWISRRSDLFNVSIQCGAILAITLVYRGRITELITKWREPDVRDYVTKLTVAFVVTASLGLVAKLAGTELPTAVEPVALALIIGGLVIFIAEGYARRTSPTASINWLVPVAVGIAQVIAGIFPGTSRSGAAIFAAMLAGLTLRTRAAEFAFLVGIPTMFAAAGYELARTLVDPGAAAAESWYELAVAFGAATVSALFVVNWLLKFISTHTFLPFAWYRLALGVGVLLFAGTA
jgi:undecaprenyl-diphosphatase